MGNNMAGMRVEIAQQMRACEVYGEYGLFHMWEQYSDELYTSITGRNLGGPSSRVWGIVEFEGGIRRVDPEVIKFCDEIHTNTFWRPKKEKQHEE